MGEELDFERARRPEQREQRRRAILDATEALLVDIPVEELSLRELARRLGTPKTNVVRYFETREGLLLALLNRLTGTWLDALEERLPPGPAAADDVVEVWARSLAERPLLCQLRSLVPAVLERNVSAETVHSYKLDELEQRTRLAHMISARLSALDESTALYLTRIAVVTLTGLWPYCDPNPAVLEAVRDPRLADERPDFVTIYADILRTAIAGLFARGS